MQHQKRFYTTEHLFQNYFEEEPKHGAKKLGLISKTNNSKSRTFWNKLPQKCAPLSTLPTICTMSSDKMLHVLFLFLKLARPVLAFIALRLSWHHLQSTFLKIYEIGYRNNQKKIQKNVKLHNEICLYTLKLGLSHSIPLTPPQSPLWQQQAIFYSSCAIIFLKTIRPKDNTLSNCS